MLGDAFALASATGFAISDVTIARAEARPGASLMARFGYAYGIVSALGYSSGYLLRKMGLAEAHDALLGAGTMSSFGQRSSISRR